MSKIYVLAGCMLLTFSAYAAGMFAAEAAEGRGKAINVALAADAPATQVKVSKSAKPAKAVKAKASKWVDEGDSRLNDYRLERESCCGPQ
jgi:hypothetical protein